MTHYVFARLITGDSIIGLIGNHPNYIEKVVRIEFKIDNFGKHITELSAILPFQPSLFPDIHESRLLCQVVPVIEELNIDLINIYNEILNGKPTNIKGNYLIN
jgi:hypothetical protein